jgi:hypothetical protein
VARISAAARSDHGRAPSARCVLEQPGDGLVWLDRGFGQVPCPPFRLAFEGGGQGSVTLASLVGGQRAHDGGADERVTERDPMGGAVDVDNLDIFGCFEVGKAARVRGRRLQDA